MSPGDQRDRLNAEIVRVATGDRNALRTVYDATSAKLFGVCLHILGEHEAAEDALQETYIKVWRRAGQFDPTRASAITWMLLIARGTAIDGLRAAGRSERAVEVGEEISHPTTVDTENGRILHDCLDRLEEAQRITIRAAFFYGYSYMELAFRTGTAVGTMKSRIRSSLLTLRRCLQDA